MSYDPNFLIGVGAMLLPAIGFFWWGRSCRLKAKRLTDTPTTPLRDVAEGFVEVKGRVKAARPLLTSPLSKKPCVYYRFEVEREERSGDETYWRTIVNDKEDCGLLVEDDSQAALPVNVQAANAILKVDAKASTSLFDNGPLEFEPMLRAYRSGHFGVRCFEMLLEVGDEVFVQGTAQLQAGRMVIDKGSDEKNDPFVVSDLPEEELVRSLHNKMLLGFFVAGILGLAALMTGAMGVTGGPM